MKNRLILLEGLPGTGKSTNSFKLYEQLLLNGKKADWLHEVSQPHPVLFFTESCMTKEEYFAMLDRSEAQYARGEYDVLKPDEDLTTYLRRKGYDI